MLTQQDITNLKDIFLEKEDFLKAVDFYMTKEEHDSDLSELIAHMATKEDLIDLENRIMTEMKNQFAIHLSPINSQLAEDKERRREQDERFNELMNKIDKLCEPLATLQEENSMSAVQYQRQVGWNHKVAEKVGIPFDY